MRPVNDIPLRDSYDVVVVGAGLGGMTAASLLAKRGLSVLTVEQQGKPGGSCTSFHLRSQSGRPCETACLSGQPCERHCYRRSFAGGPVRIAELLQWVGETPLTVEEVSF